MLVSKSESWKMQCNQIYNNFYDYSMFVYINTHTKGIIICPLHGEFLKTPYKHKDGQGCPICSREKKYNNARKTLDQFVKEANVVHKNVIYKYTYDKFIYNGYHIKGVITCENHGDFEQTPANHLKGKGCPTCKKEKLREYHQSNLEEFLQKAKEVHNDSLYKYNYEDFIYTRSDIKGIITCEKHGNFKQTPSNHLQGQGCPKCGTEKQILSQKKTLEEFIEQANKIHNNKYDYSKFVYTNARRKGVIICPEHGEFEQAPDSHLSGRSCPICAKEKVKELYNIKWSDRHSEGILYLIECWNDVERFVKIGITANSIERRYSNKKDMPYNYKVLEEIYLDSKSCIEYEQYILDISESYKPKINFGGDSECLSIDEKYYLQDFLKPLINTYK